MICSNCGSNITAEQKFCPNCGTRSQLSQSPEAYSLSKSVFTMGIVSLSAAAFAILCMLSQVAVPAFLIFACAIAGIVTSAIALKKAAQLKVLVGPLTDKAKTGHVLASIGLPVAIAALAYLIYQIVSAITSLIFIFVIYFGVFMSVMASAVATSTF